MWFEILPSAAIIYVAFNVPTIGIYLLHRIGLGNAYRRDLRWWFDRNIYLRDRRISKNPYKIKTLDCIPDEDDDEEYKPCCRKCQGLED